MCRVGCLLMILTLQLTPVTSDLLLMSKILINKCRFMLSLNHKKIRPPIKSHCGLTDLFSLYLQGIWHTRNDTEPHWLKGQLSVSLWQDWGSTVATFTENNWDLEDLASTSRQEKIYMYSTFQHMRQQRVNIQEACLVTTATKKRW